MREPACFTHDIRSHKSPRLTLSIDLSNLPRFKQDEKVERLCDRLGIRMVVQEGEACVVPPRYGVPVGAPMSAVPQVRESFTMIVWRRAVDRGPSGILYESAPQAALLVLHLHIMRIVCSFLHRSLG